MDTRILYMQSAYDFQEIIDEVVYYKTIQRPIRKTIKKQLTTLQCSEYINNRRIYKMIFNSATTISIEITQLKKKQINITDVSFYCILYLLLFDKTNHYSSKYKELIKFIKQFTFIDLYTCLQKFNILYMQYYFSFKFRLLFFLFNSSISYNNLTNKEKQIEKYVYENNNYFNSVFLSMKNCTDTLFDIIEPRVHRNYKYKYVELLLHNNVVNPKLYENLIEISYGDNSITYMKNNALSVVYYKTMLLYSMVYTEMQQELFNLIQNRIELNDTYKLYFLRASNIHNFILFIIAYHIVLSKQILHMLFYKNSSYNICKCDIVDRMEKLDFIKKNNIQ